MKSQKKIKKKPKKKESPNEKGLQEKPEGTPMSPIATLYETTRGAKKDGAEEEEDQSSPKMGM